MKYDIFESLLRPWPGELEEAPGGLGEARVSPERPPGGLGEAPGGLRDRGVHGPVFARSGPFAIFSVVRSGPVRSGPFLVRFWSVFLTWSRFLRPKIIVPTIKRCQT